MTIITTNEYHVINFESSNIDQLLFSSINKLLIDHNQKNSSLIFSSILDNRIISTKEILTNICYNNKKLTKRHTKESNKGKKISMMINYFILINKFFLRFSILHSRYIQFIILY